MLRRHIMRVFYGTRLSAEAVSELERISLRLRKSVTGRYSHTGNYHITLCFIGEIPDNKLPFLIKIMDQSASETEKFSIALGPLDHFGNQDSAILTDSLIETGNLGILCASLRSGLRENAIPFDAKPFRAHLTIARNADIRNIDTGSFRPAAAVSEIHSICLLRTVKDVSGQISYQCLHESRLKNAPGNEAQSFRTKDTPFFSSFKKGN